MRYFAETLQVPVVALDRFRGRLVGMSVPRRKNKHASARARLPDFQGWERPGLNTCQDGIELVRSLAADRQPDSSLPVGGAHGSGKPGQKTGSGGDESARPARERFA